MRRALRRGVPHADGSAETRGVARCAAGARARPPCCWSASCSPCSSARSCSAPSRAASVARATHSARPISPRWRAPARCTPPTPGCSSRRPSTAGRTRYHLEKAAYLALGRAAAERVGRANGARTLHASRSRTPARRARARPRRRCTSGSRSRRAARAAPSRSRPPPTPSWRRRAADGLPAFAAGGGYDGPLAYRQGKPMRPDVARASTAWRRRRGPTASRWSSTPRSAPTPSRPSSSRAIPTRSGSPRRASRCTASGPSSTSGRPSAYGWLAANAGRFHFVQRYSWEPWHYGYTLNAAVDVRPPRGAGGDGDGERARRAARASCRRVRAGDHARGAALERVGARCWPRSSTRSSNFNPFARQPRGRAGHRAVHAGHRARATACDDPFDAERRSTPRRT